VVAPTATATLTAGNPVVGEVDLKDGVSSLVVDVKDSAGAIVQSLELGPQAAGRVPFSWDGFSSDGNQQLSGNYHLSASAMVSGEKAYFSTLMPVKVESVSLGGALQTPKLTLADGTNIGLDKVEQIH
jgi:flagellar basal-body rod modification protein FlgD